MLGGPHRRLLPGRQRWRILAVAHWVGGLPRHANGRGRADGARGLAWHQGARLTVPIQERHGRCAVHHRATRPSR